MDEGLIQLIFFSVIVVAAILEAIVRGSKQRRQRQPPRPDEAPDDWSRSDGPPLERGGEGEPGQPGTSEGMVPRDIWEEIAALARGEVTPPVPQEPEALPAEREAGSWRGPEWGAESWRGPESGAESWRGPEREAASPREPESESETRRMSERAPGKTPVRYVPPSPPVTAEAPPMALEVVRGRTRLAVTTPIAATVTRSSRPAAFSHLFSGGDAASLRKAVILREVLGPPLALRREYGGGPGVGSDAPGDPERG